MSTATPSRTRSSGRRRSAGARPAADEPSPTHLTAADHAALHELLLLTRAVEERGVRLYKQGKIPGSFYDGRGQEAISVGATYALGADDVVCSPLIRDLGAHLVRGTDLTELLRHYLGRENAISRGREGNIHFGDRRLGVVGPVSMLPDMMVVAVGVAMAFRIRGERRCALSFFGDGATSRGDWHEAMNWASVRRDPVVFVCENNQLAYSTPTARQFRVRPAERAAAYAMPAEVVDGNDVGAVFDAVRRARERALDGGGPTLVEAESMRMHGHGAHDDASYVDPELLSAWADRDPLAAHATVAGAHGVDVEALLRTVTERVDEAVAAALASPMPDPAGAADDVFCVGDPQGLGAGRAPWSGFEREAA
ncbi:thiamine pyrophosphate-dependent dehydrogenase E1 component subunit alpha [Patulibacter defluvii]|uniref:thiamine pyrophosphate-dependent dehydrogenase E1 component subunit alpha n=1 Tax=Patulibacter defluvii TaxID=3095358 RepID=UPI002A74B6B2|nr:thiamine pyrophosphate-dependent dehydrogenase E1 component subunit alpha [Patulibacter sp. DM4]